MDLKKLGAKIISSRNARGWSQDELSGRAKVARGALQELEKGRGNPTIATLEALGIALNEPLIEIPTETAKKRTRSAGNTTLPQEIQSGLAEAARVLEALSTAPDEMRLTVLYLLLRDQKYWEEILLIDGANELAQALKSAL